MSLFQNITSDESIANERDSVGSSLLDSNVYPATIKLAYGVTASSGALGLVVHAKTEAGPEVRETFYMTSGTAKGGKNYYEKDGVKNYLPGYLTANSIALLTVGKDIDKLDMEEKVVNVWNSELKKEVPTKVQVPVELLNQQLLLGVIRETVDKTSLVNGAYVPTGETRDQNVIDKVFRAKDKKTTQEIRQGLEGDGKFIDTWSSTWAGKTRNKAKGAAKGGSPAAGGSPAKASGKPTQSLFAN